MDQFRSIDWKNGGPVRIILVTGHRTEVSRREMMLSVGQKFPHFSLTGVVSNDLAHAFQPFDQASHPGKWKVVFFWPKDFTFVCPTEIAAFGKLNREFADRDAVLYGVSTDSEFVHLAWRNDKEELRNLPFPMLDIKRELTTAWACSTRRRAWRSVRRSSSIRRA